MVRSVTPQQQDPTESTDAELQSNSGSTLAARLRPLLTPASAIFWLAFTTSAVVALINERVLFSVPYYPYGDSAVNSLLVVRAEHLRQFVGNYSRVGFHHPGPALIYMLAAGEVLFKDILHVVPSPWNGQLLGVSLYVSFFISLTTATIYRMVRSTVAASIAFGLSILFAARQGLFANDWFPVLYVSAFLLFVVAAAGIASGRTADLPGYVLASATLVQGHVAFILFVGVTTAAVGGSWLWLHRGSFKSELNRHRLSVAVAGGLLFVFLLPMVVEIAVHFPGQWSAYWTYLRHTPAPHRSLSFVLRYEWHYWTALHLPSILYGVAVVAGSVLTLTERDHVLKRLFMSVYGVLILESALTFYYLLRGVDILTPASTFSYVGYFYKTVPLVLLMAASIQIWLRLGTQVVGYFRLRQRHFEGALSTSVFIILTLLAALTPSLETQGALQTGVPTAANLLRLSPARAHRTVALQEDSMSDWPVASAIAMQMQRVGVPWCLRPISAMDSVIYTPSYTCRAGSRPLWSVHVTTTSNPPPNSDVVWEGSIATGPRTFVYVERPS